LASMNSRGSEIPTGMRKWESKARWIEPIKKRQKRKSKVGIEKVIPNGP
jgi:hypothetical protein